MAPAYREDLAYIHHAGFGDLARGAAPFVLRLLGELPRVRGLVVELGCGSGILLDRLTSAGFAALGVDSSEAMLRLAAKTAPLASLLRGSLWKCAIPPCDAVIATGEVLCYLPSPSAGDPPTRELFGRVARALPAGGVFIFDVMVTNSGARLPYRTWSAGDAWAVLVEVTPAGERRLTRAITVFRRVGGKYRRSEELHTVHMFERDELALQLRRAGFSVRVARGYGDRRLPPDRCVFIARRTGKGVRSVTPARSRGL